MQENDPATTKLRLYPEPRKLADEEGVYGDVELPMPTSPSCPYVLINMVSSVDGRSSVVGKASGIGSWMDRRAMRALRSRVDAVMVGAGSLRAEKINLGLDDPGVRQPLAVIVGGRDALPIDEHLLGENQDTLLVVPEDAPKTGEPFRRLVDVLRAPSSGPGRVDLARLLGTLRSQYVVDRLLVEGGPNLNRSLIDAGLVDEVFLTIAPKLLGGQESAIVAGGDAKIGKPCGLGLVSVHSAADEIFLRYRLRSAG